MTTSALAAPLEDLTVQAAHLAAEFAPQWLALAAGVAVFTAHAAVTLVGRILAAGTHRRSWQLAGGAALGVCLWTAAFCTWRALALPMSFGFSPLPSLAALLVGLLIATVAITQLTRPAPGAASRLLTALLIGAGLFGIQLLGVWAIAIRPALAWQLPSLGAAGVASLAIGAAAVGLIGWLQQQHAPLARIVVPTLLGAATLGMQIAVLRAVRFPADGYSAAIGTLGSASTALLLTALSISLTMLILRLAAGDTRLQRLLRNEQQQREEEDRTRLLALHDPETGLRTRASFQQEAVQLIQRCARGKQNFDLFYGALRFPTLPGDEGRAMRLIAERLKPLAGPQDFLARYGRCEFALLRVREAGEGLPRQLQEQLLAACTLPLRIDAQLVTPQAHVGCGSYPEHGQTPRELLTAAARSGRPRPVTAGAAGTHGNAIVT